MSNSARNDGFTPDAPSTRKREASPTETHPAILKKQKDIQNNIAEAPAVEHEYGFRNLHGGSVQGKFGPINRPHPKSINHELSQVEEVEKEGPNVPKAVAPEDFKQDAATLPETAELEKREKKDSTPLKAGILENANKDVSAAPDAAPPHSSNEFEFAHGPDPKRPSETGNKAPSRFASESPLNLPARTTSEEEQKTTSLHECASEPDDEVDSDQEADSDESVTFILGSAAAARPSIALSQALTASRFGMQQEAAKPKFRPIHLRAPFPTDFVRDRRFPSKYDMRCGGVLEEGDINQLLNRRWCTAWWQGLCVNARGVVAEEACRQCASEEVAKVLGPCKVLELKDGQLVRKCGSCFFSGYDCSFVRR